MKKVLVVILLVMFAGSVYGSDTDFTKTYDSRGVITFNHTTHSSDPESCVGCHDAYKEFGGEMNKNFGHKVCKTCHKSVENAPTTCTGCHVK